MVTVDLTTLLSALILLFTTDHLIITHNLLNYKSVTIYIYPHVYYSVLTAENNYNQYLFLFLHSCMFHFCSKMGDVQQSASVSRHQLPDLRRRHMWGQRGRRR